MKMLFFKIHLLLAAIIGEFIKIGYHIYTPSFKNRAQKVHHKERVVVSLTSFGRRVKDVLPYSLYSLISQSYQADVIVVYLDHSWNDNNLPLRIKKLKENGLVKIKYYDDIRSYKKLIPAFQDYPNDIIVTFDDDLYYRRNLLKRLVDAHNKYPNSIITHRAHRVGLGGESIRPYSTWIQCISGDDSDLVFPTGGAGCLYKRDFLHADVMNVSLFKELCPIADDVWFFFMEILNGTQRIVLKRKGYVYIPLDDFYQLLHKHSSLASMNEKENLNDTQIKAVMDYYDIQIINGEITPPQPVIARYVFDRMPSIISERRAA